MRQWTVSALVQIMVCRLFDKPLCCAFVKWTLQWNFNQNAKFFTHENASEIIVCEMAASLSWGRWVNAILSGAYNRIRIRSGKTKSNQQSMTQIASCSSTRFLNGVNKTIMRLCYFYHENTNIREIAFFLLRWPFVSNHSLHDPSSADQRWNR